MRLPLGEIVRRLPPGVFAFVMATGIVSTAFQLIGLSAVSVALLAIAAAGLLLLLIASVWRVMVYPEDVARDAADPARSFGFFTVVAAINVVGIRFYSPDAPWITIGLAAISVPVWLLLCYGIPGVMMLRPRENPASSEVNGSWFLWVVATQSLAAAAAVTAHELRIAVLADAAVALWGIGVMLYLLLSTLVTLRLLTTRNSPNHLGPSYWIYMGATAITVLAGSLILVLPPDLPIMIATSHFVSGFTFVLWAFGVWWVPLLVLFGIWRHIVGRVPVRYEVDLWSIVFPLGMYATASMHFGSQAHLPVLVGIGEVGTWIAGLTWLVVTVAMVRAWKVLLRLV